jgi:pSer/pThr/pTyr-binding forkhead associated (FHA) protein
VRRGPEEGQSFTLSESSVTVGRDPMTDIVLRDPEVSRQHARLTRTDEGYQIQDLGSTNGTFVEGQRLAGDLVPLRPGTVITMGSNVTLVFEAIQDQTAAAVAPESDFDIEDSGVGESEPVIEEATSFSEEAPAARVYDAPEAETVESEEPAAGFGPTEFDFPSEEEPSELSQADTGELPSFDSGYEEPADEGVGVEPVGAYDFEASDEESELPSFGDEYELPSFEDEPEPAYKAEEAYTPEPESIDRTPPPPPPPAPPEKQGRNRNAIIAAVILLVLLCCCCLALWLAWTYGDLAINYLGIQLQ